MILIFKFDLSTLTSAIDSTRTGVQNQKKIDTKLPQSRLYGRSPSLLLDLGQPCLEIYPRLCKNEQLGKLEGFVFGAWCCAGLH